MDEAELIQKPIRDIGTAFSDVAFSCEELAGALEQFASDVQQTQQAIRDLPTHGKRLAIFIFDPYARAGESDRHSRHTLVQISRQLRAELCWREPAAARARPRAQSGRRSGLLEISSTVLASA